MKLFSNRLRSAQSGQAILLIALAMVGLVAFVGLMVDVGVLFIEQGKIKRGIDSGSIAAVQQFRKNFVVADLVAAAQNFLLLNDTAADQIIVYRCKDNDPADGIEDPATVGDGTVHDTALCTEPVRRKLIRVEAQRWVAFSFLRVIGLQGRMIRASSVSEAASIDLVLAIDTSTSMAYDTYTGPCATSSLQTHCATDGTYFDTENPAICNYSSTTPCQPLADVKTVARDFVDTMFFPYDRVAVVAMTSQDAGGTRVVTPVLELSGSQTAVENKIDDLTVFEPPNCDTNPSKGPCILYGDVDHDDNPGTAPVFGFAGLDCPALRADLDGDGNADGDPTTCNSSNIGGILREAGLRFIASGYQRDESLWIVILLAGGPANATDSVTGKPDGFCPADTWLYQPTPPPPLNPFCRDSDLDNAGNVLITRHYDPTDADYDADDYAREWADFIADPDDGQGVTVFTIGLGGLVREAPRGDPYSGENLLIYTAEVAGDETGVPANHGFYSYAPTTAELDDIFAEIAANIFTRITQ